MNSPAQNMSPDVSWLSTDPNISHLHQTQTYVGQHLPHLWHLTQSPDTNTPNINSNSLHSARLHACSLPPSLTQPWSRLPTHSHIHSPINKPTRCSTHEPRADSGHTSFYTRMTPPAYNCSSWQSIVHKHSTPRRCVPEFSYQIASH